MADHYYVLQDEMAQAMRNRAASELLLPDVIDGMNLAAWDALIAEGTAAEAADVKGDTDAGRAGGITDQEVLTLKQMSTSVRNIGKATFEHDDETLYDRFKAVPADAGTDLDVLKQAVQIDAVWALVPIPEGETEWLPKKDLTRTAYQAQMAKVRDKVGVQTLEETEASAGSSRRNEVALKMHRKNKRWVMIAENSYEKYSPEWEIVQKAKVHTHTGTAGGGTPGLPTDLPSTPPQPVTS